LVAATNHGESLDFALFRRFDDVIRFGAPDEMQIETLLRNSLAVLAPKSMDYRNLAQHGLGLSHADIVRACEDAMKDAVLEQRDNVSEASVLQHLSERASTVQKRLL
jgi:AAA+ superfamily predicted ATPase